MFYSLFYLYLSFYVLSIMNICFLEKEYSKSKYKIYGALRGHELCDFRPRLEGGAEDRGAGWRQGRAFPSKIKYYFE